MNQIYNKYFIPLVLSCLSILAPIKPLIFTVGFLIFADLITGILAAKKKKKPITSAAMRRTVSKMAVYQLVIISAFLVETYLIDNSFPAAKLAAGMIGAVELTSILENANKFLGSNVFKKIINLLGSDNDR
jgi:phage-related holin